MLVSHILIVPVKFLWSCRFEFVISTQTHLAKHRRDPVFQERFYISGISRGLNLPSFNRDVITLWWDILSSDDVCQFHSVKHFMVRG